MAIKIIYLKIMLESFRSAAIIHVDMLPTAPSAFGLSFGALTLAGIIAVP